ncbi:hypothetical protein PFLUV_G00166110 [Perca fluviatilis]|uniref:HECT domain-containing protein n=1 Tax=Perca fluviatilis TaxID=8168 RepID=A0A6A5EX12_PERFL|nr:hypothetical protein PFLUV_G00166110 [Perca fluviatilis]
MEHGGLRYQTRQHFGGSSSKSRKRLSGQCWVSKAFETHRRRISLGGGYHHVSGGSSTDVLEQLFEIRLSAVGSNKRRAEECVVAFWRDYLADVEEQEGPFGGILAFATGANDIPPLGFFPLPSVVFLHELPLRQDRHLPTTNTCINCLQLPVLNKFEDFKETMDFALKNTQGFGQE